MSNGYSIDEELARIKMWDGPITQWLDLVRRHWWAAEWGWHEYDGVVDRHPLRIYVISTGGWSSNESLIEAMRENSACWAQSWYSAHRGGHYEFRIAR